MIDIKAIREAAENGLKALHAVSTTPHSTWVVNMHPSTVLALCDEIERLRKDAARYQWLKEKLKGSVPVVRIQLCKRGYTLASSENLDAVIDEAMESK